MSDPPEIPDGGLPHDSVLVVRTAALREFEERISKLDEPTEKPLGKRERDTLLVIIAALAKLAKMDVSKPSNAAKKIESQTLLMAARVAERTILDHLNRMPEAMEDRAQD